MYCILLYVWNGIGYIDIGKMVFILILYCKVYVLKLVKYVFIFICFECILLYLRNIKFEDKEGGEFIVNWNLL